MKALRDTWAERLLEACEGDLGKLMFLDETGATTTMVRTHGRSAEGERCVANTPGGHWTTMTGVAGTIEALHEAFGSAMRAVTPTDIRNCFARCGYTL